MTALSFLNKHFFVTNGCDVYDQMRNLQYCFWGLSETNPNLHYVNTYLLDIVKQL